MRTYYPAESPLAESNVHPWMLRLAWTSITLVLGVAFGLAVSEMLRPQPSTARPAISEIANR